MEQALVVEVVEQLLQIGLLEAAVGLLVSLEILLEQEAMVCPGPLVEAKALQVVCLLDWELLLVLVSWVFLQECALHVHHQM